MSVTLFQTYSGSGDQPCSMDKYIIPEDPFQSDPLISTQEHLGVGAENVALPIESDQLVAPVSHSEPVPSVVESESTQIEDTPSSANQATEEASVTPEIEKVSEGLEGDGKKAPPLTDRFYSIPPDTQTTSERIPADTETTSERIPADTETPERIPADTETPERITADTETPEGKSADTESPEIKPADIGIILERKTAGEETHGQSEGVTKRTHSTAKPLPSENPTVSPSSSQPADQEHSLQSISIFIYLLLPVFAVSFLILILYFLI